MVYYRPPEVGHSRFMSEVCHSLLCPTGDIRNTGLMPCLFFAWASDSGSRPSLWVGPLNVIVSLNVIGLMTHKCCSWINFGRRDTEIITIFKPGPNGNLLFQVAPNSLYTVTLWPLVISFTRCSLIPFIQQIFLSASYAWCFAVFLVFLLKIKIFKIHSANK